MRLRCDGVLRLRCGEVLNKRLTPGGALALVHTPTQAQDPADCRRAKEGIDISKEGF